MVSWKWTFVCVAQIVFQWGDFSGKSRRRAAQGSNDVGTEFKDQDVKHFLGVPTGTRNAIILLLWNGRESVIF